MERYELKVCEATNPELIQWKNLGVTATARFMFQMLNLFITLIILSFTTFVVVITNKYKGELSSSGPTYNSPSGDIDKEFAL